MTGYGSAETVARSGKIFVEIKSVNARFLDLNVNGPRCFVRYEKELRQRFGNRLSRGRVNIYIQFTPRDDVSPDSILNRGLLKAYYRAVQELGEELGLKGEMTIRDLLPLAELSRYEEPEIGVGSEEFLFEAFDKAVRDWDEARHREGEKLAADIAGILEELQGWASKIEERMETQPELVRDRLKKKLDTLDAQEVVEPHRLAQEVLFLAERADIREEVVRLGAHLQLLRSLIDSPQSEGRRLQFLVQELVRELSTINAKAADSEIIKWGIESKRLVEQIREQSHNLE